MNLATWPVFSKCSFNIGNLQREDLVFRLHRLVHVPRLVDSRCTSVERVPEMVVRRPLMICVETRVERFS